MNEETIHKGKTLAFVSYLTLIGTLIAFFLNQEQKNAFIFFSYSTSTWFVVIGNGIGLFYWGI